MCVCTGEPKGSRERDRDKDDSKSRHQDDDERPKEAWSIRSRDAPRDSEKRDRDRDYDSRGHDRGRGPSSRTRERYDDRGSGYGRDRRRRDDDRDRGDRRGGRGGGRGRGRGRGRPGESVHDLRLAMYMYIESFHVVFKTLVIFLVDRDSDDRSSRGSTSRDYDSGRGEYGDREVSRRQGGLPTMNAWSKGKPQSLGGEPMKKYEEPAVPVSYNNSMDVCVHAVKCK